MDPTGLAASFATIIALIGQFRSERAGKDQSEFNNFLEWLITSQHNNIAAKIESNIELAKSIQAILEQDRLLMLNEIEKLNKALASYASSFNGFSDLVLALDIDAVISKQALSILKQIEKAKASRFLELGGYGGVQLIMLDGHEGVIEVDEQRFLEDDLGILVDLKFLRLNQNKKGERVFIYTRIASELVDSDKITSSSL